MRPNGDGYLATALMFAVVVAVATCSVLMLLLLWSACLAMARLLVQEWGQLLQAL